MSAVSATARTQYFRDTRERVIDVAAVLFAEQGYAGTGVADIGAAAGLARGALYYYIRSKEAILAAIHDRVMDPLLSDANLIVQMDLSVHARLRLISESLLGQIIHRHAHVWVFLHEYRQLKGENRQNFREKRHEFEGRISQLLREGIDLEVLIIGDVELTTLAFLNLHNYTYQWIAGHDGIRAESLSEFYCSIFFRGVSTKPMDSVEIEREVASGRGALEDVRADLPDEVGA